MCVCVCEQRLIHSFLKSFNFSFCQGLIDLQLSDWLPIYTRSPFDAISLVLPLKVNVRGRFNKRSTSNSWQKLMEKLIAINDFTRGSSSCRAVNLFTSASLTRITWDPVNTGLPLKPPPSDLLTLSDSSRLMFECLPAATLSFRVVVYSVTDLLKPSAV